MLNITHLSASSLTLYRECPMAFMGRYVYQWPITSPPHQAQLMRLGSAVHYALQAHHSDRDPIIALCHFWGLIDIPMAHDLFARGLGMIRSYVADESPDPRDVCEQKFHLEIPGVSVPIIGFIDLRRGLLVREIKTTSSPTWWTVDRACESLQGQLYAYAVSQGNHGAQVTVEHHILKAINERYSHEVFTSYPTKTEHRDMLNSIRQTWSEIHSGELVAKCPPGRCRYPLECVRHGYVGTDTAELLLHGWDIPATVELGVK